MARAMREEVIMLSKRLDHLAESGVDAMAFTLLRQQVETMAQHLVDLSARMAKQDQLELQIRTLTARVEDLASVPRELAEKLIELVEGLRRVSWARRCV